MSSPEQDLDSVRKVLKAGRYRRPVHLDRRDATASTICYVVSRWGEPTQTFVRREADAVAAAGHNIEVLSLKQPRPTGGDEVVRRPTGHHMASALGRSIRRRPKACLATLWTVVTRSSLRNVAPQVAAWAYGVAWWDGGRGQAAALHAHFGWVASTAAWAASRASGTPFSVVLHAFELHTRARLDRFTDVPLRDAHTVFTISEGDAKLVSERWGIDARVLRMGVPTTWVADRVSMTGRVPHSVVSVGSLVPKKGHRTLLDAMALLDPRWTLRIAGEGPGRAALERQIEELQLVDRVELLGPVGEREVRPLLQTSAVMALACVETPSGDRDGIPLALVEAMASATPVVTTDAGRIPELVEGAGLLVPMHDPAELAAAIDSLDDPDRWRSLAFAGRRRVVEQLTTDRAIAPLLDALGPMTGGGAT